MGQMGEIRSEVFGLSARGGLHVPVARLWLDGLPRDGIAFRSDLNRLPLRLHRVLCSPVLAALMRGHSVRPLIVPWERPLSLGPLTIELLPAGGGPGASLLHLQIGPHAVLYAAAARPEALPTATPMRLAPADALVLDATLAETPHLGPAALAGRVQALVDTPPRRGVVWLFDRRTSALDVACLVGARLPLLAHDGVVQLAERCRHAGIGVPPLRRARRPPTGPALVLWPARHLSTLEAGPLAGLPRALVAEGADEVAAGAVGAVEHLRFTRRASGQELDAIAWAAAAPHVVAFGAGARALCGRLEARGLRTTELVADVQLRLV